MELRWPVLLIPIVIAIGVALWLARQRSHRGWQGELPLLARSSRLTQLPEYQRAMRIHGRLSAAALVLAVVAVTALLGATVRPTRTYHPTPTGSDTPFVDIMMCFGPSFDMQFAEDLGMVPLMTALQDKVNDFGNQRIGMTSQFYRVFPVTADDRWVSQRLGAIIEVAKQAVDQPDNYQLDTSAFQRNGYGKVYPNVVDTLAMCAMGLPAAGSDNGRSKMIVYVGDTRLDDDPGRSSFKSSPDPQLYSKTALEKTLKAANIQLDAIVPSTLFGPPGYVETLVGKTGGRQILYTDIDSSYTGGKVPPRYLENQKAELSSAIDKVLSHPPPSALDRARESATSPFQWDVPDLLLQVALIAVVGLAAARLGMRL